MNEHLQPDTRPSLESSQQAQLAAELRHLSGINQPDTETDANPEFESALDEALEESEHELTLAARARHWLKEVSKDVGIMVAVNVGGAVARRYGFEPFGLFENPTATQSMGTSMVVVRRGLKKLRERMAHYDEEVAESEPTDFDDDDSTESPTRA